MAKPKFNQDSKLTLGEVVKCWLRFSNPIYFFKGDNLNEDDFQMLLTREHPMLINSSENNFERISIDYGNFIPFLIDYIVNRDNK